MRRISSTKRQREGEGLLAALHEQRLRNDQRQRNLQGKARADSLLRLDFDFAVEIGHVRVHHVQSHAPARQLGAARRGGEAGAEEQVQHLAAAQAIGIVGGQESALHRRRLDALEVHAAAVVFHLHVDVIARW